MMIRIIKTTALTVIGLIFASNAPLSIAQDKLYKWQDASGKWYYSKTPPESTDLPPKKLEIANDARTIIFEEQKGTEVKEQAVIEQQIKQKKSDCQSIQSDIKDTALYLRQSNDKDYQEKNISKEEHQQSSQFITSLESTGSDVNFNDICMDDFLREPHIKAVSNCIIEYSTLDKRSNCLKELSTAN